MNITLLFDGHHCSKHTGDASLTVCFFILLVLSLLTFLMFTPIRVKIDSYRRQFFLELAGILKCTISFNEEVKVEIRLFFLRFEFFPLKAKRQVQKGLNKKENDQTKRKILSFQKTMNIVKSFDMKKLKIELDTNNVIWNAYLFSLFFFLNSDKVKISINNQGNTGMILHLENNLAKIVWALIN